MWIAYSSLAFCHMGIKDEREPSASHHNVGPLRSPMTFLHWCRETFLICWEGNVRLCPFCNSPNYALSRLEINCIKKLHFATQHFFLFFFLLFWNTCFWTEKITTAFTTPALWVPRLLSCHKSKSAGLHVWIPGHCCTFFVCALGKVEVCRSSASTRQALRQNSQR